MKKTTIMVLDTETCAIEQTDKVMRGNNLTYNIGYSIITPCDGKTLLTRSYIVNEIFFSEIEKMNSCYYAAKIPEYYKGIANHTYKPESFFVIMNEISKLCKEYNVTAICAHNAAFDVDALNTTCRYLTGLGFIRALPNIEIWDSMKMARSIFLPRPTYQKFCQENNYYTKHAIPRPRLTAEILYRFISKNNDFEEEHTALADVMIESEIVMACYKSHKKFEKVLYAAS